MGGRTLNAEEHTWAHAQIAPSAQEERWSGKDMPIVDAIIVMLVLILRINPWFPIEVALVDLLSLTP
eukprot:1157265-Pelagomonas_calceolata.AAC.1